MSGIWIILAGEKGSEEPTETVKAHMRRKKGGKRKVVKVGSYQRKFRKGYRPHFKPSKSKRRKKR